jgi:putative DNA primase/helicase
MSDALLHTTDLGNARRFASQHAGTVRYSYEMGSWLVWDGRRYSPDMTGAVTRLAKATALSIYDEIAAGPDEGRRAVLSKHALASQSERALGAMVNLARSEPGTPVRLEELDRDPWVLNVANGLLDLRTGLLGPHSPAALCTKLAPVPYDPAATCPTWIQFLARVLPDAALRRFLQRLVGYGLTGLTVEQTLAILFGAGANGKSTLLEVLFRLLGDYGAKADAASFMVRRNEGPRNDLAALVGARLVAASEATEGVRLDEALVKELTGGDRITARKLYADYFTFQPTFKIVLATNQKPTIASRGHAIWRRIRLVPFAVTIPEDERDLHLLDRLTEELPGVLAWAVEGALEWRRSGLGDAPAVRQATDDYRAEQDVLASFLEEWCDQDTALEVKAGDLFAAYTTWAAENHERALGKTSFGRRLTEHGFGECKGTSGVRLRTGLNLNKVARVAGSKPDSGLFSHESDLRKVTGMSTSTRHSRHWEEAIVAGDRA